MFKFQVEVNECAVGKFQDAKGEISKDDFIKFAQDSKLLDFGNAMGGEVIKLGGVGGGQGAGGRSQGAGQVATSTSRRFGSDSGNKGA